MKTKDLIAMLQKVDPSGECQVNGTGGDIYFAERLPWYYDGKASILVRDSSKPDEWNITGIREGTQDDGDKVYLHEMGIDDVMCDAWEYATAKGSDSFLKRCDERREFWKRFSEEHGY